MGIQPWGCRISPIHSRFVLGEGFPSHKREDIHPMGKKIDEFEPVMKRSGIGMVENSETGHISIAGTKQQEEKRSNVKMRGQGGMPRLEKSDRQKSNLSPTNIGSPRYKVTRWLLTSVVFVYHSRQT